MITEFDLPSQPGNERQAMEQMTTAVSSLEIRSDRLKRLQTAVAEATMNAMEHGNQYNATLPVTIQIIVDQSDLLVRIKDFGEGPAEEERELPDLEAKLAGEQSPRGWGLFLIKNMVDDMRVYQEERGTDDAQHVVELRLHLTPEGE